MRPRLGVDAGAALPLNTVVADGGRRGEPLLHVSLLQQLALLGHEGLCLGASSGMNVAGAAGFIVNGWWHGAVPSAVLNVVWMLIGGVALWRIMAKRNVGRKSSTSVT